MQVEGEVQALLARRDFLESDVDHLEQYLVAQRERIVEAVASLNDLVQRVPGGLADMRRPLLSAAADPAADDADADARGRSTRSTAEIVDDPSTASRRRRCRPTPARATTDEHDEIAEITRVASADEPPRTTRHRAVRCSTTTASRPSRWRRSTRATRLAADAGRPPGAAEPAVPRADARR